MGAEARLGAVASADDRNFLAIADDDDFGVRDYEDHDLLRRPEELINEPGLSPTATLLR